MTPLESHSDPPSLCNHLTYTYKYLIKIPSVPTLPLFYSATHSCTSQFLPATSYNNSFKLRPT